MGSRIKHGGPCVAHFNSMVKNLGITYVDKPLPSYIREETGNAILDAGAFNVNLSLKY